MLPGLSGIQFCSVLTPACRNFTGHRFSVKRREKPACSANHAYTTTGIASAGSAIRHAARHAGARPETRHVAIA